jgi:hypothetical protein
VGSGRDSALPACNKTKCQAVAQARRWLDRMLFFDMILAVSNTFDGLLS